MPGDRQSPSELVPFHEFRKRFAYLYVCRKCGHGFDSETPADKCIYCGGEVKEIEKEDKITSKPVKVFVCPNCYRKFIAEHASECPKCGSRFLHSYKTSRVGMHQLISLRRDQLLGKITKTFNNLRKKP